MAAKGKKDDIVSKSKENDIAVEENEHNKKEGWLGKPKEFYKYCGIKDG